LKPRPRDKQESWLLIKSADEFARDVGDPDILAEMPRSVVTGRTLEEIAGDQTSAVWNSNRGMAAEAREAKQAPAKAASAPRKATVKAAGKPKRASPAKASRRTPTTNQARTWRSSRKAGAKAPMPEILEPCLATLVDDVPRGTNWIHEIKWDGYRLLAFKSGRSTRILTRRGHDWTARFPNIAKAVSALPVETAILDGEAVVEDENGVSNFSALQNALSDEHGRVAKDAIFYAFDLLYLDGSDLRGLPLDERKARLSALVPPGKEAVLRLSEHIEGDGAAMVRSACQLGLEGIISKRRDRPYRSGRGEDWLKIKCTERQEFVVAGYVPSTVSARAIGSLVLGYHEGGELRHAGKTGTGFTADSARQVFRKLDKLKRSTPAFPAKLTAAERRGVIWVEPKLVAEVEFRGWTADRRLRHAAFKGLREDKPAEEVVREAPKQAAESAPAPKRAASLRSRTGSEVAGVALTHADRVLWARASPSSTWPGITRASRTGSCPMSAADRSRWSGARMAPRRAASSRSTPGPVSARTSGARRFGTEDGEEEVLYVESLKGSSRSSRRACLRSTPGARQSGM
jgi:bifunctional non-homologous end joining protein LigD